MVRRLAALLIIAVSFWPTILAAVPRARGGQTIARKPCVCGQSARQCCCQRRQARGPCRIEAPCGAPERLPATMTSHRDPAVLVVPARPAVLAGDIGVPDPFHSLPTDRPHKPPDPPPRPRVQVAVT